MNLKISHSSLPLVSIVTVNFRQSEVTCDMLDSLCAVSYPNVELVLVDNGSLQDESARWNYHYPGLIHLRSEENLGFAGGTNLGIEASSGELILMLNNDTIVSPGFLEPMVQLMLEHATVGIVSPKIVFAQPEGLIQYAGAFIGQPMLGRGRKIGHLEPDAGQYDDQRFTELPHGACMLVRRKLFAEIGLLPTFYFMYFEEHDFAIQAKRRGYEIMYCGHSSIRHRQSVSLGVESPRKTYFLHRNRLLFYQRTLSKLAFVAFLTYYLLVGLPLHVLRFLRRGKIEHLRAVFSALLWNIRRPSGFGLVAAQLSPKPALHLPHLQSKESEFKN